MATVKVQIDLPTTPAANKSVLQVILHGLVSLVETKTQLLAYLVKMDKDHKYFGGTWLTEKEIPAGKQGELKGVIPGTKSLDPTQNPVVKVKSPPPLLKTPEVHGVLVLPKPRNIHYLNRGKIRITSGTEFLLQSPTYLSAVRVLEYEVAGYFDEVRIDGLGLNWVCGSNFTTLANGARVATVHIFDAPVGPVSDDHHVEELAISSKMLGAPISIDSAIPIDQKNKRLPAGVSELELLGMDERGFLVDVFSDFIRTGEWDPKGSSAGQCAACCGAADAFLTL